MNNEKYIGMDVHQASTSIAVIDAAGKLLMECIIETKAATIAEFIQGLRGSLWVTFEEGTSAAWLYDLLKPHVTKVVVCDPRKRGISRAGGCPGSLRAGEAEGARGPAEVEFVDPPLAELAAKAKLMLALVE